MEIRNNNNTSFEKKITYAIKHQRNFNQIWDQCITYIGGTDLADLKEHTEIQ